MAIVRNDTLVSLDPKRAFTATKLGSTAATVVFTADAEYPTLEAIRVINVDGSNACTALIQLWNGTETFTLHTTATPIAAGAALTLSHESHNSLNIPMRPGWEIRVTAQSANDLEVMVVARSGQGRLQQ